MKERAGAKEKILETVIELLLDGQDASKISNREIASIAEVNSALINYYYQSKENLINLAAGECMARIGGTLLDTTDDIKPIERIKNMLKRFCDFCLQNISIAEIAVSAELKQGSLYTSKMLFPLFKEHFGESKTDLEIKLICIQLLNPMEMMFLNRNAYEMYLFIDMNHPKSWDILVDTLVDNLLV